MSIQPHNNIIAIASGKGGVGKTWLSITLTHLFARSGRRALLFDADIGLANVDVQLGLTPKKDLGNVFDGKNTLEEVIMHYKGGFDILAGRSGSTRMASVSLNSLTLIKEQITTLAKGYDVVILDLGAGIEQYVQFMASIAGRCVVVITDEPTSLTDAYAFIKLCTTKLQNPLINIIVNQAASQKEGERTFMALSKACENFLKINPILLGIIRKDNKVRDAIRAQSSLIEKAPHTLAATDAAAISVKLMQQQG
jgi:flagellar biosynthesis protein FlhG